MQSLDPKFPNSKRPARTGALIVVGRAEDLPHGKGATVELDDGQELALYNIEGQFYAVENFCPHRGAPLAEDNLAGHTVECDWHGWRFDLRTGACFSRAGYDIETYEVLIEDGLIKIRV